VNVLSRKLKRLFSEDGHKQNVLVTPNEAVEKSSADLAAAERQLQWAV
jgi:hypothetical protein